MITPFVDMTDEARAVMEAARKEAQRLHHGYLGTEHILFGLLHARSGGGSAALASMGVDPVLVRRELKKRVKPTPDATASLDQIPFTQRTKSILEHAAEFAEKLGHSHLEVEHLLYGCARETQGIAASALKAIGADRSKVEEGLLQYFKINPRTMKPQERREPVPDHLDTLLLSFDVNSHDALPFATKDSPGDAFSRAEYALFKAGIDNVKTTLGTYSKETDTGEVGVLIPSRQVPLRHLTYKRRK